jgi:hypothetical protein
MQRTMVLTALAVVFAATVGTAFAEQEPPRIPPRGTEGPDVRYTIGAQRAKCDGVRLACPPDSRGVEDPETR